MTFSTVTAGAHATGAGTDSSPAIDTTGADLIVIALAVLNFTIVPIEGLPADNKSNTWTRATALLESISGGLSLFYCVSPTVGSGHTFQVLQGSNASIAVQPFSGCKLTSPLDQTSAGATGSSVLTQQGGSLTPSENNELVIAGLSAGASANVFTIDSGFATPVSDTGGGGNFPVALSWLIQTTAGATNPTWTLDSNDQAAAQNISFKAAVAAGTGFGALLSSERSKIIGGGMILSRSMLGWRKPRKLVYA